MHLSDIDIINFRNMGHLGIEPWNPESVQPASYDLHLAPYLKGQYMVHSADDTRTVHWTTEKFPQDCRGEMSYELEPGEFALFSTIETVTLSSGIVGQVMGKSSLAREGLITENAGLVDAGFSGTLTLEFSNISAYPITLYAGMAICQITFAELRSPAQRPYGTEGLGSRYQHQTGPTSAR